MKTLFTLSITCTTLILFYTSVNACDLDPTAVISVNPGDDVVFFDGDYISLDGYSSLANCGYITEYTWYIDLGPFYQTVSTNADYFPDSSLNQGQDSRELDILLRVRNSVGNYGYASITIRIVREPSSYYYLTDHLGSVRVTVNDEGDPVGWDDYYPFGLQMPGRTQNVSNPNDDAKFTGYLLEQEGDLGLYHAEARFYDPVIGRFNSVDPMASKYPGNTPYHYVLNTPVNAVDPDGRVVVFINGRHNLGRNTNRQSLKQLWGNSADRLMSSHFEGEFSVYRDGSNRNEFSRFRALDAYERKGAGFSQSNTDYGKILAMARNERERGLSGTVKLFTHSMGAAYGRGYAMGLLQAHAESGSSDALTIEFIIDIAPFQQNEISGISNLNIFHAVSNADPLSGGMNPSGSERLGATSISSEDYMHLDHHRLQSYSIDQIMREINDFLEK